jgi:pimeloyl-ACP methyl ester carboxylesterase
MLTAQTATPPPNWSDGYVMTNGIRIHYWRTGGDKPPLVLAHGYSDDGLCWTNLAKELEADFDIIMIDARGHGLSDPPSASDPADAQAEDLAGLIQELKLDKPIVMGHSMGSSAVAWFAAKYPDVPRAVVLEDPGLVPRPNSAVRSDSSEMQDKMRAQILQRNNMPLDQIVAECMEKTPQWGLSECEFWAPSKRLLHPDNSLRSWDGRPATADLFSKIVQPTLILKAEAEPDLQQQNEKVASILPNGKIVHIEGAGHNIRRDQKQRLLDVLQPFLAEQ